MPATLDRSLVQGLITSFPNGSSWKVVSTNFCVADRGDRLFSTWAPINALKGVGGVYAFLLPLRFFPATMTIPLHAPHSHAGVPIQFEFSLSALTDDGYAMVYVGRSSNLHQRWRGHLTRGRPKDGAQVPYGLVNCGAYKTADAALRFLREHGRIVYTVLDGPDNCANRDILELSLCAEYVPPFNIKSER